MQRFSLKSQSCFLLLLISTLLLGDIVALDAMTLSSANAETTASEPAPAAGSGVLPPVIEPPSAAEQEALPVLPPVVVLGERNSALVGATVLSREEIERLPSRNGSVNELLLVLPGVQVSDSANLSTQAGEIAPPALSISGGKIYQNNFQIDGQGMNLILDPLNTKDPSKTTELPSSAQSLVLNKGLIKEIIVLDHNISARYGSFAGGVVDAKTRDPADHWGGDLFYRTTRDNWTRFHVEDNAAFKASNDRDEQPRFEKSEVGASFDLPLTENSGLLAAVQQVASRIPLVYFDGKKTESRQQENYFLKYVNQRSKRDRFSASLISTPFRGDYFRTAVWNSDYSIDTKSVMLATDYRLGLHRADLRLRGSYADHETSRNAPRDFKVWNANLSESKAWGKLLGSNNSNEGGYGDIINRQKTLQLGAVLEAERYMGEYRGHHQFVTGVDYTGIEGEYRRPETSYYYFVPKPLTAGQVCDGDTATCLAGEQYLSSRFIYKADAATARLNQISLYLEDTMTWGRVSIRPGVRFSRDDYMQNTDTAPRLTASWDLFGDHATEINVGANRYYSNTLLAGQLREAINPLYKEVRTSATAPWGRRILVSGQKANRYSDLETPYIDELAAGFDQALGGGRLNLAYVARRGKKQFASELGATESAGALGENPADQLRFYKLTNKGHNRYGCQRASWQRSWDRHNVFLNLTRQEVDTQAESYLERLDDETLDTQVAYHGRIITKRELPDGRQDFNRKWVGNLVYTARLPLGVEFTNVTRYRSGGEVLKATGEDWAGPDGVDYPMYDEMKIPASWLFDWIWIWRHALTQHQELAISLEIYNVFDRTIQAGTAEDQFELGRQFWVGAEYRF